MNIYVFPNSKNLPAESRNPYISHLIESLSNKANVINKNKPSSIGLLDLLFNIHKTDVVSFNWIENIVERRGGQMQVFIFFFVIAIMKLKKGIIVYTLHNKISHSANKLFWKNWVFKSVLKYADIVLTHASEGITFAHEKYKVPLSKLHFIHHPVYPEGIIDFDQIPERNRDIDILIWGTIAPYKGLDLFLAYISKNELDKKYRILIAGKISPPEYVEKISAYSPSVEIRNEFISEESLSAYMERSKNILFTYNSTTVLSSGALIRSLNSTCVIIGPNTGSFKDLAEEGLVRSFNEFEDIPSLIDSIKDQKELIQRRRDFINENSWEEFSEKLIQLILKKESPKGVSAQAFPFKGRG
jgi:beta-1,4-mannosyltransferase